MPELKEVGSKVMEIEGVNGFLIINPEANIALSENIPDEEKVASSLALCALHADGLKDVVGMTKLRYLLFTMDSSEELLVLPVSKHLIGVMKASDVSVNEILKGFRRIFSS
jgi:hypothetical protein